MVMYIFLLVIMPLYSMNISDAKSLKPTLGAIDTICDQADEPYKITSDLTQLTIDSKVINSPHPIIEIAVNQKNYGYSTNQIVEVCSRDDKMLPIKIRIEGVDKLLWSPNSRYLLMRSTWDGLDYYVCDLILNKLWRLERPVNIFSRVATDFCTSLSLSPLISRFSDVRWHDNNVLVDRRQKMTWHIPPC